MLLDVSKSQSNRKLILLFFCWLIFFPLDNIRALNSEWIYYHHLKKCYIYVNI